MIGFIRAYRYALGIIKKLNISKETQRFLLNDYNNRLKIEVELLKHNGKVDNKDKKIKELYEKLDLYIESDISKVESRREKTQEER